MPIPPTAYAGMPPKDGDHLVEIPFKIQGNRRYLTLLQVIESPALQDFIRYLPDYFEYDPAMEVWWSNDP